MENTKEILELIINEEDEDSGVEYISLVQINQYRKERRKKKYTSNGVRF